MQPVTHLNYQIDKLKLFAESQSVKNEAEVYTDPRYPGYEIPGYLIKHYTSEYTTKIMNDLGVQGKSRFYWLHPFTKIPEVLERLIQLDKPFILIMPSSKINTQYFRKLFSKTENPIQIIVPRKRIQFEKLVNGEKVKNQKKSCNFDCFYYCYKMGLERDIVWLE
jgi:hypothetical protein